jgi:DNA polymerase I-like protein with 3'-5' exonuclease and polymerase domains
MIYFVTKNATKHEVTFEEDIKYECCLEKVIDYCKSLEVIGFDKETTGLDAYLAKILLIILGDDKNQYVIDAYSFTSDEVHNMFISIGLDKIYLGQNLKFDYKFAKVHYNIELRNLYDVMIAEQRLTQSYFKATDPNKTHID